MRFVFAVALTVVVTSAEAVHKADRPDCLPVDGVADTCAVSAGSTDYSGFVTFALRGTSVGGGEPIGRVLFRVPWTAAPTCEVRGDSNLPAVKILTAVDYFEISLASDSRMPRKMRRFYTCKGLR